MSALAKAITRATRRRPDRYDLRLDFENGLYSVAHHDKDSLDLNFLSGFYLAEQDAGAGAFDLTDLVTWTRTDSAYYRDPADGLLKLAGADVPRIHAPPPRVLGMVVSDDLSGYADATEADAAYGFNGTTITFNAAGNRFEIRNSGGSLATMDRADVAVEAGKVLRLGVEVSGLTEGDVTVREGTIGSQSAKNTLTSDGIAWTKPFISTGTVGFYVVTQNGCVCDIERFFIQEIQHAGVEAAVTGANAPPAPPVGALVEPEREQRVTQSNTFDQWSDQGVATTVQDLTGPDGATSGWTLTDANGGTTYNRVYRGVTLANTNVHTGHFIGRFIDCEYGYFRTSGLGSDAATYVDLRTGEVVQSNPNHLNVAVSLLENGWVWMTLEFTPSDTSGSVFGGLSRAVAEFYPQDGSAGGLWYVGVEEGAAPTMPIPTTTVPVTRSRDLVDFDLEALGVYQGGAPFSLVVDMQQPGGESVDNVYQLSLYDDGGSDSVFLYRNNTVYRLSTAGTTRATQITPLDWDDKDRHTLAFAVNGKGELRVSVDGGAADKYGANDVAPVTLNTLRLGAPPSNPSYTAAAMFYGVHLLHGALSDAELVEEAA